MQHAPADRAGHVQRPGELGDPGLGLGRGEQRQGRAQGAEQSAPIVEPGRRGGDAPAAGLGLQPPQVHADVRQVVAAVRALDGADVHRAAERIEGGPQGLEPTPVAQVRREVVARPDMVHPLGGGDHQEIFDHARRPAGDVARELLQHRGGSQAPPEADGVGDLGPGAGDARGRAVQRPIADQAADVGRCPVGAGLDELVVVELLDVLLDDGRLLGDHAQQLPKREALLGVADAVDGRQQGVEALGGHPHGITCRSTGDGSRVRISAARSSPAGVSSAGWAKSRSCRIGWAFGGAVR